MQINNGKFSVEEASKIAQKYYGTNQTMMKKAKDLIDVCAKRGNSQSKNGFNISNENQRTPIKVLLYSLYHAYRIFYNSRVFNEVFFLFTICSFKHSFI